MSAVGSPWTSIMSARIPTAMRPRSCNPNTRAGVNVAAVNASVGDKTSLYKKFQLVMETYSMRDPRHRRVGARQQWHSGLVQQQDRLQGIIQVDLR